MLSPDGVVFGRMLEGGRLRPILGYAAYAPVLRYMTSGSVPLAAGAYVLECRVAGLTEDAVVSLRIADAAGLGGITQSNEVFNLSASEQTIRLRFEKAFSPYECFVVLSCIQGECRLEGWQLRPDAEKILGDLAAWGRTETVPSWVGRGLGMADPPLEAAAEDVTFGRIIRLRELGVPSIVEQTDAFKIRWRAEASRRAGPQLGQLDVFVHLQDADGKQAAAAGFVLWEGLAMGDLDIPVPLSARGPCTRRL